MRVLLPTLATLLLALPAAAQCPNGQCQGAAYTVPYQARPAVTLQPAAPPPVVYAQPTAAPVVYVRPVRRWYPGKFLFGGRR